MLIMINMFDFLARKKKRTCSANVQNLSAVLGNFAWLFITNSMLLVVQFNV